MIETLTKRKNLRLQGYDYSLAGGYFVTICASLRGSVFGMVEEGEVVLNEIGKMVQQCWEAIPKHFPLVELDVFIVMPDHFHGILFLIEPGVGARHASPDFGQDERATHASPLQKNKSVKLGTVIGSFKSAVTKHVNKNRLLVDTKLWQRGYYDHIIRNEQEFDDIREYIIFNAIKQEPPDYLQRGEKWNLN